MGGRSFAWFQLARRFTSSDALWQKESYRRFAPVQLRWRDNDLQGHVKDTVFYNCMTTLAQRVMAQPLQNNAIQPYLTASSLSQRRPIKYPQPLLAGYATSDVTPTTFKIHVAFFGADNREWLDDDDRSRLETDCYETEASVVGTETIGFRINKGSSDALLPDVARQELEKYCFTAQ